MPAAKGRPGVGRGRLVPLKLFNFVGTLGKPACLPPRLSQPTTDFLPLLLVCEGMLPRLNQHRSAAALRKGIRCVIAYMAVEKHRRGFRPEPFGNVCRQFVEPTVPRARGPSKRTPPPGRAIGFVVRNPAGARYNRLTIRKDDEGPLGLAATFSKVSKQAYG